MFSGRVPDDRRPNRLSAALARARETRNLIDLTVSNPTQSGIRYPPALLDALAHPAGLSYCPQPFGLLEAREAVAETYTRRGLSIDPHHIVLTASTSDAYSLLFKLLCDPGRAEALTPAPSYPLFDHLTRLDGVGERRYALHYHGAWSIDLDGIDRGWNDRTRCVLIVSPNNPTGSLVSETDADELVRRGAQRDAALIVDEVFHDYTFQPAAEAPALQRRDCLLFRLGGLSKSAGLPQMKLGWMTVEGPDDLVKEAMDRLELICDTYLSVSTPVQLAARTLLHESAGVRDQIRERVRSNYHALRDMVSRSAAVTLLESDGGWSAVLRVPAVTSEESLVLRLLEDAGVLVHPGFFFDFPQEAYLVLSLLPEPHIFTRGVRAIVERVDAA